MIRGQAPNSKIYIFSLTMKYHRKDRFLIYFICTFQVAAIFFMDQSTNMQSIPSYRCNLSFLLESKHSHLHSQFIVNTALCLCCAF